MPLLSIVRFLASLFSLIIIGIAGYLAWRWYDGALIRHADGDIVRVRETWFLWLAIGLGLFSFFGKTLIVPILARADAGAPSTPVREPGEIIDGAHGSKIFVAAVGNGPTIVLTHGWAMDSTVWRYAIKELSASFRVVVWDLPGLGRSEGAISLEDFARNLRTVVEWSGNQKVVLVGHSIGGMTIQTLVRDDAAFVRDRVGGAVLFNTTFTNPLKTMILPRLMQALRWPLLEPMMRLTILLQPIAWLSAWLSYLSGMSHIANRLGFGKYVTRSQLEHVTLLATRNPPGNISKGNLAMFRWDATNAFSRTDLPILILAGDVDIVTKPQASDQIATQCQQAVVRHIAGVNHMGMLERAENYNAAVADFAHTVLAGQ